MGVTRWDEIAACRGQFVDDFYPDDKCVLNAVKNICTDCPVKVQCRIASIPERFGFWAGLTQSSRQDLRSRTNMVLGPNDADVERFRDAADEAWRTGKPFAALAKQVGPAAAKLWLSGMRGVTDVGSGSAA